MKCDTFIINEQFTSFNKGGKKKIKSKTFVFWRGHILTPF